MTVSKRALGALAAAALTAPLLSFSTAYAAPPDPPAVQNIETFCAGVDATPNPFTDIAGNTHERAIECAAAAEIARGGPEELPDTQYGPFRNVRRDQMASFIARMMDKANELDCDNSVRALPAFDGNDGFQDVDASNTHYQAITRLEDAGIVLGGPEELSDDFYGPARNIRRDQMASFISRAVNYMTGSALPAGQDYFTDDEASTHEDNINRIAAAGITNGFNGDTYGPATSVPRDQMASFIIRTLADLEEKGEIVALNEECPDAAAPTITDGRVATDAAQATNVAVDPDGATGTASEGDFLELTFSEAVATDSATATPTVSFTDGDGESFDVECVEGGAAAAEGNTAATCTLSEDGLTLTIELLEDPVLFEDPLGSPNGVAEYPLTVVDASGFFDAAGNEVVVDATDQPQVDRDENTQDTNDPSPLPVL